MKAISIRNPWADLILGGEKTIEVRTWQTKYRGDLLICSSANPKIEGMISGYALCIVSLDDIEPFKPWHCKAACIDDWAEGYYAWHFSNVRLVAPFKVKGKLNFYDVDDKKIKIVLNEEDEFETEEAAEEFLKKYYYPYAYTPRKK